MHESLFGSDLWKPALDKYAEATGLSVELFDVAGETVFTSNHATPLFALFREFGFEPGLFAECARRCLKQTYSRPALVIDESHGLSVVGTSLVLDGAIVGAAVAGYALARFPQVTATQRWASSARLPFERLWGIVRRQPPVPERRLLLHGELLQVLGDTLLRENYRTRQYEEAVVQLNAAAAAKDEFLAVLSHELRTPLAPIAGWASILKNSQSWDQVREAATVIERNAFIQSRMIDDLLDVNRIAHGAMELDLNILELQACVRAALESVALEVESKKIRLEIVEHGDPLFVAGDGGRMQQIFRNILSNAVKFTPAGGRVRVTLAREESEARVIVADTGKGIEPDFLPFAFDIFRQQEHGTRRAHEGLGIGLALVKKITELHRGTVSIASEGAGRGAEVTVRLPLTTEVANLDDAPRVEAVRRRPSLVGLSILVVDDAPDAREVLQAVLEHLGARVAVAQGGREALDALQYSVPDLVLCELRMAGMDGFEFIHELERGTSSAHPPVVAVSALASDADRRRTREAGFAAHIKKPFNEAALVAAVDEVLGHQLGAPLNR